MITLIRKIPLFAYLLAIYNLLLFTQGSTQPLTQVVGQFTLASGAMLAPTLGDVFIMVGVAALYMEIFKATRSGEASIHDHLLSMLVFVAFLVEFLLVGVAGTVSFFTLTLMSFLDVIAGFTVTISTARRDFTHGGG